MSRERQPWERRDGSVPGERKETQKAYQAFLVYRDLGHERRHADVVRISGRQKAVIERWSVMHDWVERAERWDDYQARLRDEDIREQRRKEIEYAEKARYLLFAATRQAAAKVLQAINEGTIKPKPRDVKALADAAMALSSIEMPADYEKGENTMTLQEMLEKAGVSFAGILGRRRKDDGEEKQAI